MPLETSRRKFLIGTASALASPSIIRVINLMPIKPWIEPLIGHATIWEPFSDLMVDQGGYLVPYNLLRANSDKIEAIIIRQMLGATR